MGILLGILSIVIGYLLGSIPSAYLMGRLRKGIDIRNVDSGNMGAGVVIRQVGVWEGILVGLIDIAKGSAAILIARALGVAEPWVLAAGFGALLGHNFPLFIGFKGGSGAATSIGIFLVLAPVAMGIALVIIAIPILTTRNFAFAAFIGLLSLPLLIWLLYVLLFGGSLMLVWYSLVIDAFMLGRNLPVLKRAWPKGGKKNTASSHRPKLQ
jgi:glycerol-3-phosphate acyltransferase PlsY